MTPFEAGIKLRTSDAAHQRARCPQCGRDDRDQTLGFTWKGDGWVAHCFRCDWVASSKSVAFSFPPRSDVHRHSPRDDLASSWQSFWNATQPWQDSLVERYLSARQCAMPAFDADIRFAPACWHWPSRTALPAMVALLRDDVDDRARSLHFTFLNEPGKKAPVDRAKLLLRGHRKAGASIRLTRRTQVGKVLGIAEGLETALALAHAEISTWAMVDASNLASFAPLPGVDELIIAVDHDLAGRKAADHCARRWRSAGKHVRRVQSNNPGEDIADVASGAQ